GIGVDLGADPDDLDRRLTPATLRLHRLVSRLWTPQGIDRRGGNSTATPAAEAGSARRSLGRSAAARRSACTAIPSRIGKTSAPGLSAEDEREKRGPLKMMQFLMYGRNIDRTPSMSRRRPEV